MNYFCIEIRPPHYLEHFSDEKMDILTALLSELPFDTFDTADDGACIRAYIPELDFTETVEAQLTTLSLDFDFEFSKQFIAYQNWNKLWESNFQPIVVDDFVACRADFHPPTEGVAFDLVINPKMAFGTGHHETTFMMMQAMRGLDFQAKSVLDFGCGTGVLAILASKMGATRLLAIDIEMASYENTLENCQVNGVANVVALQGVLSDVPEERFDVILANINRNVILDSLRDLNKKLENSGFLLISGFLKQDFEVMQNALKRHNFSVIQNLERGNWVCQVVQKGD
jgi:ribosomal protein L11 methyltransferase